jgi:hypothetical protein
LSCFFILYYYLYADATRWRSSCLSAFRSSLIFFYFFLIIYMQVPHTGALHA